MMMGPPKNMRLFRMPHSAARRMYFSSVSLSAEMRSR